MEFKELERTQEEYKWALNQMWDYSHPHTPIEEDTLIQLGIAINESIELFDVVRQRMVLHRTMVIASIITKCSHQGFPMKWPENAESPEV